MKVNKIEHLVPIGHKVVIKTDVVKKKSDGGIMLIDSHVGKEQDKVTQGILISAGDMAFQDMVSDTKELPVLNSKVFYVKYSGIAFKLNEKDEFEYRVMNDEDVYAFERIKS